MMDVGHTLDMLVAEQVMKLDSCEEPLPHYSTSIADAWLIVEKLHLTVAQFHTPEMVVWLAGKFQDGAWYEEWGIDGQLSSGVMADTAPLAICLSALKAAGKGVT